jgi:hypothetical protein
VHTAFYYCARRTRAAIDDADFTENIALLVHFHHQGFAALVRRTDAHMAIAPDDRVHGISGVALTEDF